ncbi:MAG: universal stress protein [Cyanobacteria bacterium P01_G01_bin.38]
MLSKILVAIDQSVASQRAFETALELAKALGAELTLVHALDVFDPGSPERPSIPVGTYSMKLDSLLREDYERQWAEFVDHYDALLKQKQTEAQAVGVTASYVQPYGCPGPVICKAATTSQADFIVVGSHGRAGLSEMMLGSVSNYIMHHATCSVMVIHPDGRRDHLPKAGHSALSVAATS